MAFWRNGNYINFLLPIEVSLSLSYSVLQLYQYNEDDFLFKF